MNTPLLLITGAIAIISLPSSSFGQRLETVKTAATTKESIKEQALQEDIRQPVLKPQIATPAFQQVTLAQANVRLHAILGGGYLSSSQEMKTNLSNSDLLPQAVPAEYLAMAGAASASIAGTTIGASVDPATLVDWVLVEAREVGGEERSFLSAALLRSDGTIVSAEDGNDVEMTLPLASPVYFIVHHRNHLSLASTVDLTVNAPGSTLIDDLRLNGTSNGSATVSFNGENVAALSAGNYRWDGAIQTTDLDAISEGPVALLNVYHQLDGNIDGVVQNTDIDQILLNMPRLSSLRARAGILED